jgi:hypothetical protein
MKVWISFFFFLVSSVFAVEIDQVVVWGHKLHTHTHSYIHYGFYKAFTKLGYKTLWLDNRDDLASIDFSRTLFITEHQVDQNMPLRENCYYFVHCSSSKKYDHLKEIKHFIDFDVYKNSHYRSSTLQEVEPCIFYDFEKMYFCIPWATDLLPEEIELNKLRSPLCHLEKHLKQKRVYWIGTIGGGFTGNLPEVHAFATACKDHGIEFIHSDPWGSPVSFEKNIEMIQSSYLAPAICGALQVEKEYIPCRIFKNISYGHLGLTNSKAVYDLFDGRIIYDPDPYQLFLKGEDKLKECNIEEQYALMDFIKEHHTYLNRAQHMINFVQKSNNYWNSR